MASWDNIVSMVRIGLPILLVVFILSGAAGVMLAGVPWYAMLLGLIGFIWVLTKL